MKILTWKKKLFSSTYNIYYKNVQIGMLKNYSFSNSSIAEMNGFKYTFRTKGILNQSTKIYNEAEHLVGEISYNSFMTKAKINLNTDYYFWKYNTFWNTKWIMQSKKHDTQISACTNSFCGSIETNTDDELAILSGIFVTNYYLQMTIAIMIAVFIPILTSILYLQ